MWHRTSLIFLLQVTLSNWWRAVMCILKPSLCRLKISWSFKHSLWDVAFRTLTHLLTHLWKFSSLPLYFQWVSEMWFNTQNASEKNFQKEQNKGYVLAYLHFTIFNHLITLLDVLQACSLDLLLTKKISIYNINYSYLYKQGGRGMQCVRKWLWSQDAYIRAPALPCIRWVTLAKFIRLSRPPFFSSVKKEEIIASTS